MCPGVSIEAEPGAGGSCPSLQLGALTASFFQPLEAAPAATLTLRS